MAHRTVYATADGRYGTRMLRAGQPLLMTGPQARAALALGKVQTARPKPVKADKAHEPQGDDIASLRAEYQAKFDKRPFNGWDADTLRAKIDEA